MPFVKMSVKEEIEKRKKESETFAEAWDKSREEYRLIGDCEESKNKLKHGKETVDVCLAIQKIRENGEIVGVIHADKKRGLSQEDTKQYIMEEYQKSEEEADELIEMYW